MAVVAVKYAITTCCMLSLCFWRYAMCADSACTFKCSEARFLACLMSWASVKSNVFAGCSTAVSESLLSMHYSAAAGAHCGTDSSSGWSADSGITGCKVSCPPLPGMSAARTHHNSWDMFWKVPREVQHLGSHTAFRNDRHASSAYVMSAAMFAEAGPASHHHAHIFFI